MEDLQKEQEESEQKFDEVSLKLDKGAKLVDEIRKDSRESFLELQDVRRLNVLLSGLYSDYRELVTMWEEKNKSIHLIVCLKSFQEDSKQVHVALVLIIVLSIYLGAGSFPPHLSVAFIKALLMYLLCL